jgi:tetratricopeptide (TPR) repeat protein
MMDLLGDFDPNRAEGGQLDVGVLLDQAVERVDGSLKAQPDVQARLFTHVGKLYYTYSRLDDAKRLHERALSLRRGLYGEVHPDVAESVNYVAWAYFVQGAHQKADSLYRISLAIQDRLPEQVMLTRTATINELALVRRALGDNEGGLALAREAYDIREEVLGPDDPVVVTALSDLASMHFSMGHLGEAAALFERVVAQRRRLIGTTLETAQSLNDYGAVLTSQGDYEGASRAHGEALAIRREILGDKHPQVAQSLSQLGWALQTQGRYAEAEPLHREALAIRQAHFGETHASVGNSLLMLGEVMMAQDDFEGGLRLGVQAVQVFRELLGREHRTTLAAELRHARGLQRAGRPEETRAFLDESLPRIRAVFGADHARTREAEALLASLGS